jgi:hypothetical protein
MPKFTKIPQDTFDHLQIDVGVLLKNFDPESAAEPTDEDIITATKGGVNITCVPTYSDMGEDVDNCPVNTMELKKLSGWNCGMKFESITASTEMIKLALGAADISGNKITPRRVLKAEDFSDLWWVGDTTEGGHVAIKLMNALSSGGFSWQTGKDSKGSSSLEIQGHVSIKQQDVVPMEFYVAAASA